VSRQTHRTFPDSAAGRGLAGQRFREGVVELTIDTPVKAKIIGVSTALRTLPVSVTDPRGARRRLRPQLK
jgi:hypothetical protein